MVERNEIEKEVKSDLGKDYEHLLIDIYDEILNQPTQQDALIHSFKRISSLFAKMGMSSERLSDEIKGLTRIMVLLTVFIVILTILILVK